MSKLKLQDGYHTVVHNGDLKDLCNGGKSKALIVSKNVLKDLYISKACKFMDKVIEDVIEEVQTVI